MLDLPYEYVLLAVLYAIKRGTFNFEIKIRIGYGKKQVSHDSLH